MSEGWRWEYDPDDEHVTAGVPNEIVGEVERLTRQLAELAETGVDITSLGNGPAPAACAAWTRQAGGSTSWPPPETS